MRLSWGLVLGLALGAQANRLAPRQDNQQTTPPPGTTTGGGSGDSTTTPPSSSSPSSPAGSDTTVFVTATVTGAGGSTVSQTTTAVVSSVTTVTVTSTNIATTTITKSDGETSTKTVYVTSTQTVNMKRSLDGTFEFVGRAPAQVEAKPTAAPSVTGVEGGFAGLRRFGNLEKRAVVTSTVTVTVGGGGATTVFQTVTKSVKSTTTTVVQVTSLLTETFQANAKTTVTETSTIISKLTVVSTGATETQTSTSDNNGGSGDGGSDGLSTGAKAGIGVGAGVGGLAIIGAIIWLCTRRRRGPKPDPDDLLGPSSEVPVGAGGSRHSRPMAEGLTSTPGAAPRRSPVLPNVQPEGYRGTAMGDGRAGYAKPEPYGAAYAPTRSTTNSTHPTRNSTLSPGDQLPRHPTPDTTAASVSPLSGAPQTAELGNDGGAAKWHTAEAAEMATDNPSAAKWHSDNAHEIDSQPAMSHQSGPVYEMSTEQYK